MKAFAIRHVGIASEDSAKTAQFFIDNLGAEYVRKLPAPRDGMESTYVRFGEEQLEIMQPYVEGEGTIGKYLAKGGRPLHHISLAVDDVDALEKDLESKGILLIGKGIVEGNKGFFIHPKACGILIEIFQYDYVKDKESEK